MMQKESVMRWKRTAVWYSSYTREGEKMKLGSVQLYYNEKKDLL